MLFHCNTAKMASSEQLSSNYAQLDEFGVIDHNNSCFQDWARFPKSPTSRRVRQHFTRSSSKVPRVYKTERLVIIVAKFEPLLADHPRKYFNSDRGRRKRSDFQTLQASSKARMFHCLELRRWAFMHCRVMILLTC